MQPVDDEPIVDGCGCYAQHAPFYRGIGHFPFDNEIAVRDQHDGLLVEVDP